ncbi:MAG: P1 family peptidase [Geminicoccaceae bacterium]
MGCAASGHPGTQKARTRDLGIPFDGEPGPLNAITDVAGIEVGYATLISGAGRLEVGKGPVRTGVSAILPRGRSSDPVFGGWFSLNGNGEMTGTTWIEESGFVEGPVMITNTHSVGIVRDAVVEWMNRHGLGTPTLRDLCWLLPVVGETCDGFLNDINGHHVSKEHAFAALDGARAGPVAEGNVGGGTGMMLHMFKGGTGTASRRLAAHDGNYTVGILVQANYGTRQELTVAGVPVGRAFADLMPGEEAGKAGGSCIVIVATDAPLLPHQLERLARRVPLGIGRTGGIGANSSGDIFIAFSTANPGAWSRSAIARLEMLPNDLMNPLLRATIEATEEAVINALVAAETMTGRDGHTAHAIPHDRLREILRRYGRLIEP